MRYLPILERLNMRADMRIDACTGTCLDMCMGMGVDLSRGVDAAYRHVHSRACGHAYRRLYLFRPVRVRNPVYGHRIEVVSYYYNDIMTGVMISL